MILNLIFALFAIYIIISSIINKRPFYKKMKRSIGFRGGKLIYLDKQMDVKQKGIIYSKLLKSDRYGISGKPDYIYQVGDELIPLELKSSKIKEETPYYKDVMQLVAYFLIIEETYGKHVKRGRIVYQNVMFEIYNRKFLKKQLLIMLDNMRKMENGVFFPEIQPSFSMCRFCPCRGTVCEINKEKTE
ncbi:MAG: CRISPR-associated protein Cas4 [Thermoanaerobacteraceae bacterium]